MWGFRHKGAAPHSSFCECRFHTPQAWPRSLTWLAKSHREGSHVGRNRSLGNGGKRKHRQVLQVWLVIVPNHNIHHCCYYHSLLMFMMNIHHGSWPFEAAYMKVSFITGVTSISKIRPWLVLDPNQSHVESRWDPQPFPINPHVFASPPWRNRESFTGRLNEIVQDGAVILSWTIQAVSEWIQLRDMFWSMLCSKNTFGCIGKMLFHHKPPLIPLIDVI